MLLSGFGQTDLMLFNQLGSGYFVILVLLLNLPCEMKLTSLRLSESGLLIRVGSLQRLALLQKGLHLGVELLQDHLVLGNDHLEFFILFQVCLEHVVGLTVT